MSDRESDLNICPIKQRTSARSHRLCTLVGICLQLLIIQVNLAQQVSSSGGGTRAASRPSHHVIDATTTTTTSPSSTETHRHSRQDGDSGSPGATTADNQDHSSSSVRRAFVMDLLRMLHEQYAEQATKTTPPSDPVKRVENRQSTLSSNAMVAQLIAAIGADGDVRRLIDWIRNSFSLMSIGEVATQFVVSKLGSINCAALLQPDREETLVPRFLLFNEHFVDVPFELSINPDANECMANGRFDPQRKTMILIHGYLAGYTLVDGITNIKNRILDLNKYSNERAMDALLKASQNNGSYVLTDDLQAKVRRQLYNVVIVDWFNGANPVPRADYIRAAVNAQVVGRLIARFLSALIVQCGTPASNLQIIAHSLGCHVSGFTGKALNAAGHRLGKITHLDPVGLCFGRLFSQSQFRLRPDDALETQAVHVSLNIFDNPLDGVHNNFLVNGGRDQIGCGGQNELKNSTTSSLSLLFNPDAKFAPCSHLRAVALFEEDLSSGHSSGQCQMVGHRCPSFERFVAGKCGFCDSSNSQCRLMSLPPLSMRLRKLEFDVPVATRGNMHATQTSHLPPRVSAAPQPYSYQLSALLTDNSLNLADPHSTTKYPELHYSIGSDGSFGASDHETLEESQLVFKAPSNYRLLTRHKQYPPENNEIKRRSDSHAELQGRRLVVQMIGKIRQDTRTALVDGWTNLRSLREHQKAINTAAREIGFRAATVSAKLPSETAFPSFPTTPTAAGYITTNSQSIGASKSTKDPTDRQFEDLVDQIPVGGQPIPRGSVNGPLFFLGTSSLAPYCVNYYQFRVLIAESRLQRVLMNQGLASNRLAPPTKYQSLSSSAIHWHHQASFGNARELLHLTVKLSDTSDHFFKGFSMIENARQLTRVSNEFGDSIPPLPVPFAPVEAREPMAELTMLLNTTQAEPIRVGETIISYYFHSIVLADRIEINYMSNISPEIRAKYSSVLCPVAINDRHQLVRYVECHKV